MGVIEFSGKIEHGQIRLPVQYAGYNNAQVRVVVWINSPASSDISKKERLRIAFQKMKNINMFSKIQDPVAWQKQLRDEWE
jgi:hypothetical protein